MTLYVIFYKETSASDWATFRLLMPKEEAKAQVKSSPWHRAKIRPITPPL